MTSKPTPRWKATSPSLYGLQVKRTDRGLLRIVGKRLPQRNIMVGIGHREYYSIGNYRKWAFYPQASLTYMKTPEHILQLSLSTQKTYPGYWECSLPSATSTDIPKYGGTPGLRPQTNYSVNANYVVKQKYVFGAYFSRTLRPVHANGLSVHRTVGHDLQDDELELHTQYVGLMATVPFRIGTWWDSRWVAVEQHARHRCDDFFDLPFDRKKWILQCQWDNTFKLNKNLTFNCADSCRLRPYKAHTT